MEPFEVIIFEFLLGYALQGFTIVLGIYAFNRQRVIIKSYVIASVMVIIISYFVRLLPISFGVHTILNMLIMFLICIFYLKTPAYNTIKSALLVTVLLLVCEMADVAVMMAILGQKEFERLMLNSLYKALVGLPGTILFVIIVVLAYVFLNKQAEKKGVSYGNASA
jgi:hypothetical protein